MYRKGRSTPISPTGVFQKIYDSAPGGFMLDNSVLTPGAKVAQGTPMGFDEITRIAKVVKQAVLYEVATPLTSSYKVLKGHHFQAGEFIAYAIAGKAVTIMTIDQTPGAYDRIVTDQSLGINLHSNDVLFEAPSASDDSASLKVLPKGLIFEDAIAEDNESVSVIVRATVYERRLPTGICDAVKSTLRPMLFTQASY